MLPFTPREPMPSGDDVTRADVNVLEKIDELYHSAQNDPEYKPENFDFWLDSLSLYQRQKARYYLTELRQHIQSLVGPFPNNVTSAHRELERAEKRLCEELDDQDEQKPQELTSEQTREAEIDPGQPAQELQASINPAPNSDGDRHLELTFLIASQLLTYLTQKNFYSNPNVHSITIPTMPANVFDNTLVTDAALPINPSSAPKSQMAYKERCKELKRIIYRKKNNIDAKHRDFDKLQDKIVTAEKVKPVDSATIDKLTKELVELHAYIEGMLGIHNFFVKEYQTLIAEKSESVKANLFNEMGALISEAEGVDSDDGDSQDENDQAV
ncbi:unnamed protein product [Alternaria sp. RS040]